MNLVQGIMILEVRSEKLEVRIYTMNFVQCIKY